MLRTTLRQSRSIASLRVAAAASTPPVGARGLASSALFQSVSGEQMTVPVLKKELAQRGLSTVGKKAVLLARLNSAQASFPSVRSASSSPPAFAPKAKTPAPKETSETNTDTVTAPATAEISSPATAEVPAKEDLDASKTSSPGLPNNPFDSAKKTLDVKMPAGKEDADEGTAIPTILGPGSTYPPSAPEAEEPESHPKLMTAASASTHIAPPRSHINALSDSHSIDVAEGEKEADDVATGNRPLNEQERAGLWAALFILGSGYLASLGLDTATPKVKKAIDDAEDKLEAKIEKGKKVVGKKLEGAKDKAEDLLEDGKKKASDLKSKAEDLTEEGRKKAEDLKKAGKDKAADLKDKAEDVVDDGKAKAKEVAAKGSAKVDEAKEAVKEKTK